MRAWMHRLMRFLVVVVLGVVALQVFFLLRIASMRFIDPSSTSFERSNWYALAVQKASPLGVKWQQTWVPYEAMSVQLKRAIIASEDASFTDHDGVDWAAIEKAWEKNRKAELAAEKQAQILAEKAKKQAQKQAQQQARQQAKQAQGASGAEKSSASTLAPLASAPAKLPKPPTPQKPPKTVGGSTITQQLAKNLFLSGERTYLRKAQEYVLVVMLEALLPKKRIFEIYLNHVEWGEGIFGAQAAAQYYFHKNAAKLNAEEASLLAVMLPRPKYFEQRLYTSGYLSNQAAKIRARMGGVDIP